MKEKSSLLVLQDAKISVIKVNDEDYISLTDMITNFGDSSIIKNWLRNRNTIEFLGVWEKLNNPNFNSVEFDLITEQLLVLANLESHNAIMIHEGISQPERLAKLNKIARIQMNSLLSRPVTKKLIEDKT